jgi:hypothetical protein
MAERSEGSGSPFNLNSLLAILTLAGSVWLVSQKLSSDRPAPGSGEARGFLGEQTLEARLWEDPFKETEDSAKHKGEEHTFDTLRDQIRERSGEGKVLLMPVMLSGGHYSEDQESRIRSRFAIESALARSRYAPEDAEHLGVLKIRWPSKHELETTQGPRIPGLTQVSSDTRISQVAHDENSPTAAFGSANATAEMRLTFEWHKLQKFSPARVDEGTDAVSVLVLWVDDSFFDDEPLLRLPLLLEPLLHANGPDTKLRPKIALLGPRRSSTLKAMVRKRDDTDWSHENAALWETARKTLTNIVVFSATASAMDEALVENNVETLPREAVRKQAIANGFNSFSNFAATDSQLAREIFDELELRGVSFHVSKNEKSRNSESKNHVALISEADTFYGQLLSLTYEAELKWREDGTTLADYVTGYRQGTVARPHNFHSFSYFRGLDGQTVGREKKNDEERRQSPASIEDLRKWTPDANRAEGEAQFDYLGRIGDQLVQLQKKLHQEGSGRIKAIGIVGSDCYDVLLILQALRGRFPDTMFFTTDLDARLYHPKEKKWARNLIVASGYGLSLHPEEQLNVAPFRESGQTAQFASALAALGNEGLLSVGIDRVVPRRFEIGNRGVMDLSPVSVWPHPLTTSALHGLKTGHDWWRLSWAGVLMVIATMGLCYSWKPLRRLTVGASEYACEPLPYDELDAGGPEAAEALHVLLQEPKNSAAATELEAAETEETTEGAAFAAAQRNEEKVELVRQALARKVEQTSAAATDSAVAVALHKESSASDYDESLELDKGRSGLPFTEVTKWSTARRTVDNQVKDLIARVVKAAASASQRAAKPHLQASCAWREAGDEIADLRSRRVRLFRALAAGFGALGLALGVTIWKDTLVRATGETFSLTSGTSIWPAEILRVLVLWAGIWLCFELVHGLRETFFQLTRKFRFGFEPATESGAGARVEVLRLWKNYRESGRAKERLRRIYRPVLIYLFCCVAIIQLFDVDFYTPARGVSAQFWDKFLTTGAVLSFLTLTLLTFDAARLCREFISKLTKARAEYPETTRHHFSRQLGNISDEYLDEWLSSQLIADLTERVGKLVYYPCILVLLLVLARNSWWDAWSWPAPLIIIFGLNFALSLAGVMVLQHAAREAKSRAEESLSLKIKQLQHKTEPDTEKNNVKQAEELLEEIRSLRRGAFAPFWENPIVGALFLSSGGTTILQMLIWGMGR